MYRGFNINYLRESFGIGYETRGLQVQEPIKKKLKESFLRQIIKEDNSLEASLIMDTTFPVEAYDIFFFLFKKTDFNYEIKNSNSTPLNNKIPIIPEQMTSFQRRR